MHEQDPPAQAEVDGVTLAVHPGEPILMAILRNGLGWTMAGNPAKSRGPFCNMGVCQECVVKVEGRGPVRACLSPIEEGDVIEL